jgi:hypothetical protein
MLVQAATYADNLGDLMLVPLVILTVVAAHVGLHSFNTRESNYNFGSVEYANATWRVWASTQGTLIGWVLWLLLASVPAEADNLPPPPLTFAEKQAQLVEVYDDAYDTCIDNRSATETSRTQDATVCERLALAVARPDVKQFIQPIYRTRVRTQTKTVVRRVAVSPSYERLYARCTAEFDTSDTYHDDKIEAERTEAHVCHNNAAMAMASIRDKETWTWNNR